MTKENQDPVLGEKDQEIIAVGASVASGCLPCTKFHLRVAAGAGAGTDEIRQAVGDALRVRRAATDLMAVAGGLTKADAAQAIPDPAAISSRIRELTAIAAAYAVNCSSSLEAHMTAARALGATEGQMFAALKIACAVRDVASQKAKAMAGSILGVSEEQAVACDCGEDDGEVDADCSCRPAEKDSPSGLDKI